ncbi:H-NS histone family protein [Caballeronia sp. RCC_10]|uniref:H-NS histone family protein n=1 Tax=Caballeronia sp. RCC_10 TaxID=3239227 RepID=UPI003523341F
MATLDSLQAKIAKLQAQAQAIAKRQSTAIIAQIHSLMNKHGISVEDLAANLGSKKAVSNASTKVPSRKSGAVAKYRDPKSGATWSGHGRAPGWIASAKNRDRFLIENSAGSAPIGGRKTAKPGNYRRGPQPALYRDPKSGAEWSGRGKAPSWLAGAKDRTKFLIDGAAPKAADAKEGAPTAVTAKKAAAKKATATVSAKKGAAKKASATSAKTTVRKGAAAKKSTSAAKKGPLAGSKKAATKKVAAKRVGSKVAVEAAPDPATSPQVSSSETSAATSAS